MSQPQTVHDLASRTVLTLQRNDTLSIADDLMRQKRVRHLPVLDEEGLLCGVVSQRDLFRGALVRALGFGSRAEEQMLESVLVKEVMSEPAHTTTPGTPLREAARTMLEKKVGCLPVLEGDRLVGILTESDLLRLVAG